MERQALDSQLKGLVEAEASLEERRKSLLESLGLDSMQPDAELVDIARALDQLRAARIKYEGAAGRVDELEANHSRLLSDLADVLQRHGEPPPADATARRSTLAISRIVMRSSSRRLPMNARRLFSWRRFPPIRTRRSTRSGKSMCKRL